MSSDPFHIRRPELKDDDPSVLSSYLHSVRNTEPTQRMTGTEIKALRSTTGKKKGMGAALIGNLLQGWQGLISGIGGMFVSSKHQSSSCTGGHNPPKTWGDGFPRCIDCGVEIRSPDDLRGSSKFR